jgi:hypothetical protein
MRLKNTFVFATIGAMVCAGTAFGQIQSVQDGNWSSTSTWQNGNVPGAGEDAVVKHAVTVDGNVTVDSLNIQKDATVDFSGSYTLEITDPAGLDVDDATGGDDPGMLNVDESDAGVVISGGGTQPIDGKIDLSADGSFLRIEDANATLGGGGELKLSHSAAELQIEGADGRQVTIGSSLVMRGFGLVKTDADAEFVPTFANAGNVHADAAGKLRFMAGVAISGAGDWHAETDSSAQLQFSQQFTCASVTGDFNLSDGAEMIFDFDDTTRGTFTCTGTGTVSGAGSLEYGTDSGCNNGTVASGCS